MIGLIGVTALVAVIVAQQKLNQTQTFRSHDSVIVAASFYPHAFFAQEIGGNRVSITNLTPVGAEPHEFVPTAKDIASIYQADVFLYNGAGVDAWATATAKETGQAGVETVQMSSNETIDGHIWLDPILAKQEVETIRDAFITVDPAHEQEYVSNADALTSKLTNLDLAYSKGLASCEKHIAITSHAAFGYLAKRYGFEQMAITGFSPEQEPSAGDLAQLTQKAKTAGVKYIFFETLVNPKLAQTLAQEIGGGTLVFNPIEGLTQEDLNTDADYFSIMQSNLEHLKMALVCQVKSS